MSTNAVPGELSVLSAHDVRAMAVALARRGPGGGINPQVGCVIVRRAPTDTWQVLGVGWHEGAGTPHAEVAALADAHARGNDVHGATAVVTLQPCNSFGRTGPCAAALVAAGVGAVSIGALDPAAEQAGSTGTLEAGGVEVTWWPEPDAAEARELVRVWLAAGRLGRPYVTVKTATTLDARIAAADGTSQWITGPAARAHAHSVRAQVGAIAVGTGTALADDPQLTARNTDGSLAAHQPLRVIIGQRPLPPEAHLFDAAAPTLQLATHDPHEVLAALAARGVTHLLVEGGRTVTTAFLRAGVVDEIHAYIAPLYLSAGLSAVGDLGVSTLGQAARGRVREARVLGDDALLVIDMAHGQEE